MHLFPVSFLWCQDACSAPPGLEEEWDVTAGLTDASRAALEKVCVYVGLYSKDAARTWVSAFKGPSSGELACDSNSLDGGG